MSINSMRLQFQEHGEDENEAAKAESQRRRARFEELREPRRPG
jgi:hypothetical protein